MGDREYWWWYVEELASLSKQGPIDPSSSLSHRSSKATTPPGSPEDLERLVGKVLQERGKWAPFNNIDRDELELTLTSRAEQKTVVSGHSGQRLWIADLEAFEMNPLYWKGGSIVPLRRAIWMIMPTDPSDDAQGGIPCPADWEFLLEDIMQSHKEWLDYSSEMDTSQPVEKTVQLGGVLSGYLLLLKRGVGSMGTLIPNPSYIAPTRGLMKGIIPSSPPKPIRLIRGYSAYYGAIVTAINDPERIGRAPPPSSMEPPPKIVKIPPSPFEQNHALSPKPVKHVVFVVHGIGQKLAEKVGFGFVSAINSLRRYVLAAGQSKQLDLEDVYILPIEWRVDLDMGSGYFAPPEAGPGEVSEFDSLLNSITLPSVPAVRTLATDVTMDVLLYMTPRHFNRIIDACVKEIRRVHSLFTRWNPNSAGFTKFSLIGHSLGSALVADVLGINLDYPGACQEELDLGLEAIDKRLGFEVENFFSLGSPLPLFLLLKHIKPVGCAKNPAIDGALQRVKSQFGRYQTDSYPKLGFLGCRQLYNLFMPYDPVAYRMEPLVVPPSDRFGIHEPMMVPYRKGGMTGLKLGMAESFNKTKQDMLETLNRSLPEWVKQRITTPQLQTAELESAEASTATQLLKPFNVSGRVDYSLQDSLMENSYLSSISSHFLYWSDEDVAYFLIAQLFN